MTSPGFQVHSSSTVKVSSRTSCQCSLGVTRLFWISSAVRPLRTLRRASGGRDLFRCSLTSGWASLSCWHTVGGSMSQSGRTRLLGFISVEGSEGGVIVLDSSSCFNEMCFDAKASSVDFEPSLNACARELSTCPIDTAVGSTEL